MRKPAEIVKDELQDIIESNKATEHPSEQITLLMTTVERWHEELKKVDSRGRLDGSKLSKHKKGKKATTKKR